MAYDIKNLAHDNLGFYLGDSTFQRVIATVQDAYSNEIYVAFAIETGGFGTFYI